MKKTVTYLTKEQLEKLPTPRLLAYKKKIHQSRKLLPEWWEDEFKLLLSELNQAHQDVIVVLATREHVEKKMRYGIALYQDDEFVSWIQGIGYTGVTLTDNGSTVRAIAWPTELRAKNTLKRICRDFPETTHDFRVEPFDV